MLRRRSRSGSLRSSLETSATTSETFMRSSTASSRSLIAAGLHRGAHSHCFSNLLPVKQTHLYYTEEHTATASATSYLSDRTTCITQRSTQPLLQQPLTCRTEPPVLHRGAHSHCFSNLLPVRQTHLYNGLYYIPTENQSTIS